MNPKYADRDSLQNSALFQCGACLKISRSRDPICAWCGVENAWQCLGPAPVRSKKKGPVLCETIKPKACERLQLDGPIHALLNGGYPLRASFLVGGKPGSGKSSLAIELCQAFRKAGRSALYVSHEMESEMVAAYIQRITPGLSGVQIWESPTHEDLCAYIEQNAPALVVLDSLQRVGGASRAAEVLAAMLSVCAHRSAFLAIAHASKESDISGEIALQHDVGIVGELKRDEVGRELVILKSRYGPAPVRARL